MNTVPSKAQSQTPAPPAPSTPQAPELGKVRWGRDLDQALARSTETAKPVLILFDEVPGCHTCIHYGQSVLSRADLVTEIETHFIPVAIFNNGQGKDKQALERFNEPAWNNPVVRIVDAHGRDLTPRVDGDYTLRGITSAMITALTKVGAKPSENLRALAAETGLPSR